MHGPKLRPVENNYSGAVRNIPPVAVRLLPEIKHALAREAAINQRSLHAEIVLRLKASLGDADALLGMTMNRVSEAGPSQLTALPLGDAERQLLAIFRGMSPEKQLALLSLIA